MMEKRRGRGRGPVAIASEVAKITRAAFGRRGFADAAIATDWPSIVGDHIGRLSAPEQIVYPGGERRDGTLHLRIENGALALALQHLEPVLIERINGYFGFRAVSRVRLNQGPVPPRPARANPPETVLAPNEEQELEKVLTGVVDPGLRQTLDGLGRAILGRQQRARGRSKTV